MLLVKVADLEKLNEKDVLRKCMLFSINAKALKLKEYDLTIQGNGMAPPKELHAMLKTATKKKEQKKLVKKYVKSVIKKNHSGLAYVELVEMALKVNYVPVIVMDETSETYEFDKACILATFKELGVKPLNMKDLKKEKVLKGKSKDVRKGFRKFFEKNFEIKNAKAYESYRKTFAVEILCAAAFTEFEKEGKLNKDARRKYFKKLTNIINDQSKKQGKKLNKQIKKLIKFDIGLPNMKKFAKGKFDEEDILIVLSHLSALKLGDFGSKDYMEEMVALFTRAQIDATRIAEFKSVVEKAVAADK